VATVILLDKLYFSATLLLDHGLGSMRQKPSDAMPTRTALSRKYRSRAFYIVISCIALFAGISAIADRTSKYRHGLQYGALQRRALEKLDPMRLIKRDEEVAQQFISPRFPTKGSM
jgi:hypothetical protein